MEKFMKILEGINWQMVLYVTIQIILVLVIAWALLRIASAVLRRLEQTLIHRGQAEGEGLTESAKRVSTLVRLLRQGVTIVVLFMAGLVLMREVGIEIGPILASAGVVGVALGFGAQSLVKDVISGFFIILENQVRVGDVAIINGTGGSVEKINFRTIVLRDQAGTVYIFPNGTITTMANMTREWSAYVFNLGVAYKEDTDKVVEVIAAVARELKADSRFGPLMIGDVEVYGVDKLDDSAVVIQGRIKTRPIKQWEVGREFQRRIKKAFDTHGIEIPFPCRSLYFGESSKPILTKLVADAQASQEAVGRPAAERLEIQKAD